MQADFPTVWQEYIERLSDAPIRFSGENFRKATAQDKLTRLKNLMD